jgi:hypothetical protein
MYNIEIYSRIASPSISIRDLIWIHVRDQDNGKLTESVCHSFSSLAKHAWKKLGGGLSPMGSVTLSMK